VVEDMRLGGVTGGDEGEGFGVEVALFVFYSRRLSGLVGRMRRVWWWYRWCKAGGRCTCEHGVESINHVAFVLGPCYVVGFWRKETVYSLFLEHFIMNVDFRYGVDIASLTLLLCY